jgi:hypothetical protein
VVTWEEEELLGIAARVRYEPDEDWTWESLKGDMFDPEANADIPQHSLRIEELEFEKQVELHGVWGIIGEYRCSCCGGWIEATSLWGVVGGYEDAMEPVTREILHETRKVAMRQ